jgi:hypothetical protein
VSQAPELLFPFHHGRRYLGLSSRLQDPVLNLNFSNCWLLAELLQESNSVQQDFHDNDNMKKTSFQNHYQICGRSSNKTSIIEKSDL